MDYYHISAQELGQGAKLPILKLGDSGEVFYEMALEMVTTPPASTPSSSARWARWASTPSLSAW